MHKQQHVENTQIGVKTTGPSQLNLLPVYACGITPSSSLDSTKGNAQIFTDLIDNNNQVWDYLESGETSPNDDEN